MIFLIVLLWTMTVIINLTTVLSDEYEPYYYNGAHLKEIPTNHIPDKTTEVDLHDNRISEIKTGAFSHLTGYLTYNQMRLLDWRVW